MSLSIATTRFLAGYLFFAATLVGLVLLEVNADSSVPVCDAPKFFLRNGEAVYLESLPQRMVSVLDRKTTNEENQCADASPCRRDIRITTIDEQKGLYYVEDFLTPMECHSMIGFGTPDRFTRSPVVEQSLDDIPDTDGDSVSSVKMGSIRTSSTCPLLFSRIYMPLMEKVKAQMPHLVEELILTNDVTHRAADLLFLSAYAGVEGGSTESTDSPLTVEDAVSRIEPLQLIHYRPGEFYQAHHDHKAYYMDDGDTQKDASERGYPDRERTMLVFLNTVEHGGHLKFDSLHNGLQFVPHRGDAVIWSNVDTTGVVDHDMIHQGMPPDVVDESKPSQNDKYALNIWIRNEPIDVSKPMSGSRVGVSYRQQ